MTVPLDDCPPPGLTLSSQLLVWAQPDSRVMKKIVRATIALRLWFRCGHAHSHCRAASDGRSASAAPTIFLLPLCIRCNLLRVYDPFLRDLDSKMRARKFTRVNYFYRAVVGFDTFQHH